MTEPEDCPEPSNHEVFLYCPVCTWTYKVELPAPAPTSEPSEKGAPIRDVAELHTEDPRPVDILIGFFVTLFLVGLGFGIGWITFG